jgi:hypothetical protein
MSRQTELQQALPAKHALPHAPQWAASPRVSTHVPPQQVVPAAQTLPQEPQLPSSLA